MPDQPRQLPRRRCGDKNPTLNTQKNRTKAPADLVELSVADFKREHKEIPTSKIGKSREDISDELRAELEVDESVGVSVEGYIVDSSREKPEDCNCYVDSARDYHVWLGTSAGVDRSLTVVVELTPRLFQDPKDQLKAIKHKRVRVVGWPLFDPQHPEQVGNTRYARWEVHPVTDIEVQQGDDWVSIFAH